MSRFYSYLNSTKEILQQYKGEEPFAVSIKKFFAARKKFGSKDRKQITHLCYCFFRMGKTILNVSLEEKILLSLFLCSDQPNEILRALKPEWNEKTGLPLADKILITGHPVSAETVFPPGIAFSTGIELEKFFESFFIQPDLFLRLRPGKEKPVLQKLEKAGIRFEVISGNCIALPNATKIEDVLDLDREAVIQDLSSQLTGEIIKPEINKVIQEGSNKKITLWDCCSGSGGKSIMLHDIHPGLGIMISDMRESILANLEKRFRKAGIGNYRKYVLDLFKMDMQKPVFKNPVDMILADVPCSGSGTWSRTPEQLYFFNEQKIETYSSIQKKMVSNVVGLLSPGGVFIYITCSVFKKENEEVAEFIQSELGLLLIKQELITGFDKKADTLFVAVFSS